MILTKKQTQAIDILEDNKTIELYYGGAAGGGKSVLGCYWQLKRRLKYPETRGLIGRSSIKTLKETTLQTFFAVAKLQGVKRGTHFDLTSAQDKEFPNCLVFYNGSFIYLKDLFNYPNDPDFDELGSLEITDGYIDEAPQVTAKCKGIVRSRMRFGIEKYNLIPKLLMTGNPAKNWSYSEFYKPSKEGTIDPTKKFIPALPNDNPNLPKAYIDSLHGLEKNSKERLLFGNWEYSDDPTRIMRYEKILELFTNKFVETGDPHQTCDIAYEGSDIFVIGIWEGLRLKKVIPRDKINDVHVPAWVNEHRMTYKVPMGNLIYDADGLQKFTKQSTKTGHLFGAKEFHNGGKPVDPAYFNLKAECYFKLSELVETNQIYIEDLTYKDQIIQELEQIRKLVTDDNKIRLERKSDLRERLGRSPDFADMIMMRMLPLLKPKFTPIFGL